MTATLTPPKFLKRHSNGGEGLVRMMLAEARDVRRKAFVAWAKFMLGLAERPITGGDAGKAAELHQQFEIADVAYKPLLKEYEDVNMGKKIPSPKRIHWSAKGTLEKLQTVSTAIERAVIPASKQHSLANNCANLMDVYKISRSQRCSR